MGRLVQQSTAAGADRLHPAGRGRGALLWHAGSTSHGSMTQTKQPPANPGRFIRGLRRGSALTMDRANNKLVSRWRRRQCLNSRDAEFLLEMDQVASELPVGIATR